MSVDTLIALEQRYCAHNYDPLPVVISKGEGVWLWDIEGKKYLDMLSAYSAVSFGHSHPRLVHALYSQAKTLAIASRAFYNDKLPLFLQKLCTLSNMDMALPMNSGAEAVETAIKAARRFGYRVKGIPQDKAEIIVASDNFHGRTNTIISFSSDKEYKKDFGPLAPGFKEVLFGDAAALKDAITKHTCAFIVEPIQGEAGIIVPPDGYLKQISEICKEAHILLILDEIQSGLGRTGKMFAYEHEGIKPDGLILGKALGGGLLPVSAFLSKKEVLELFEPGSHGSTFGGNALSANVALEALTVLEEEKLSQKSAELGAYMLEKMKAYLKNPFVKDVRGRGLWVGVEFDPVKLSPRLFCQELMKRGILAKETHQKVVRFAPPLVITKEELDWALSEISALLDSL